MVVPKSCTAANIQAMMTTQLGPVRLPSTTATQRKVREALHSRLYCDSHTCNLEDYCIPASHRRTVMRSSMAYTWLRNHHERAKTALDITVAARQEGQPANRTYLLERLSQKPRNLHAKKVEYHKLCSNTTVLQARPTPSARTDT